MKNNSSEVYLTGYGNSNYHALDIAYELNRLLYPISFANDSQTPFCL